MTNPRGYDQVLTVAARPETDAPAGEGRLDLREVFRMHGAYVWNSLRRLGVAEVDLEDVTHDVFVQVHKHLAGFDTARPVRPWLFAFAFRVASQYRRRAHRHHETSVAAPSAIDPDALADERIAAEEDRRLVMAALDAIELGRRAVFVLHEIDGIVMEEIARSLGIPVNTAYSRLRVARAEFATAVKRMRHQEGER